MAGFIASLHTFSGTDIDAMQRRVRVRPDPPAGWNRYTSRWQVAETRFDVVFERSRSGTQTVQIMPLDSIPDGYTLSIGARVDRPSPASVRVNGAEVEGRRTHACNPDLDEVWTDVPFTGDICAEFTS
jgi:hypothetical protein